MDKENNIIRHASLIRHYIKITYKISPLFFFTGGYIVWFYLNQLGWNDIFPLMLNNGFSFIAVLIMFFILFISFSIFLFFSNLFMMIPIVIS